MDIRIKKEQIEQDILNKYATKSKNTLGRYKKEDECPIRTCFQRDRDRIIHTKAFRRLKDKTQVFISPEGDHFRTRITHTLEVSQIARTISSALFLNEDLTEAIALGHDLGHTPFGHVGEEALSEIIDGGFRHNEQSIRVVQNIENKGNGLNLTKEVLDGILNHRGALSPSTLEAKVVQISDKIAYINHDIDDAIRANILKEGDLPKECVNTLGNTHSKRINFLIENIIKNSTNVNDIIMEKSIKTCLYELRGFMFENVYKANILTEERKPYHKIIIHMYKYYCNNFDKIPKEFSRILNEQNDKKTIICDYIAGMTDRYAINIYKNIQKERSLDEIF